MVLQCQIRKIRSFFIVHYKSEVQDLVNGFSLLGKLSWEVQNFIPSFLKGPGSFPHKIGHGVVTMFPGGGYGDGLFDDCVHMGSDRRAVYQV